MRKGRDGEIKKTEKKKIMVKIVATTSLPVDRLTATDCNAAARANNGENSGPLTSLPVDRLTATDCNAAARANIE